MRVLVTGGAGFIGSHLVDRLRADGHVISIYDNYSTSVDGREDGPPHDVLDRSSLQRTFYDFAPNFCFHLAAVVGVKRVEYNPILTWDVNSFGAWNVIDVCHRSGVPIMLASSSEVALCENHLQPMANRMVYAYSKLAAESIAMGLYHGSTLHPIVVRLFNVVGPRQRADFGMVLPTFICQAQAGRNLTICGDGTQQRTFAYVGDVVDRLMQLMECKQAIGKTIEVGNTVLTNINELAAAVNKACGRADDTVEYILARQADCDYRCPNTAMLEELTGRPAPNRPIAEVVEMTLQY